MAKALLQFNLNVAKLSGLLAQLKGAEFRLRLIFFDIEVLGELARCGFGHAWSMHLVEHDDGGWMAQLVDSGQGATAPCAWQMTQRQAVNAGIVDEHIIGYARMLDAAGDHLDAWCPQGRIGILVDKESGMARLSKHMDMN